jgi:hypothetical protein
VVSPMDVNTTFSVGKEDPAGDGDGGPDGWQAPQRGDARLKVARGRPIGLGSLDSDASSPFHPPPALPAALSGDP